MKFVFFWCKRLVVFTVYMRDLEDILVKVVCAESISISNNRREKLAFLLFQFA